MQNTESVLEFTEDWFDANKSLWNAIINEFKPKYVLEIGSFEGRSTCFTIFLGSKFGPMEIHCIDTWEGGIEHDHIDFKEVERRFDSNMQTALKNVDNRVTVIKHKGKSLFQLCSLVAKTRLTFDMIYVDGSHVSSDVIGDAVLSWELLRVGGVLIFDDYDNPNSPTDPLYPRLAIDSFLKIYDGRYEMIKFIDDNDSEIAPNQLYQLYIRKLKA